jgi:hypothetical protein
LETASWTEADTALTIRQENGRPGTLGRPAPARAGDARSVGDEDAEDQLRGRARTDPKQRSGADAPSRDEASPSDRKAVEAIETQESSGLGQDATLLSRMSDCQPTETPGGAAERPSGREEEHREGIAG